MLTNHFITYAIYNYYHAATYSLNLSTHIVSIKLEKGPILPTPLFLPEFYPHANKSLYLSALLSFSILCQT